MSFKYSILFNNSNNEFTTIEKYIINNYKKNISNFICNKIKIDSFDEDNQYKLVYSLPYDKFKINYNNNIIEIKKEKDKNEHITNRIEYYENLNLSSNKLDILEEFITLCMNEKNKFKKNFINIQIYKYGWGKQSKIPSRDMSSIYLDGKLKKNIINDIEKFLKSENEYKNYGIPWKRTYLLEGLPGTGKTSLIVGIASKFNLNISVIDFSSGIDDCSIMNAITGLDKDQILLIEDIDSFFEKREKKTDSSITFSTFLNIMDGIFRRSGLITFLTTNHKEKLDNALLRVGRIDFIINFTYCTKEQIELIFKIFRTEKEKKDKNDFEKFYLKIKNKKVTTAILQKFMFDHRENDNIIDYVSEIDYLIDNYKNDNFISNNNMYS